MNLAKAVKYIKMAAPFGVKPRRRRAPRWAHPDRIEAAFEAALAGVISQIEEAFGQSVMVHIPDMVAAASPGLDSARADDWADDLEKYLKVFRVRVANTGEEPTTPTAEAISNWNLTQWRKITKAVIGVEINQADPRIEPLIKSWAAENAAKITKLKQSAIADVESRVRTGLRNGTRAETIASEIKDRFGVSKSYAKLVARDQVSKLNGNITKSRQTSLGVTHYFWRTAGDDRVRQTHEDNDGKRFAWDSPPAKTGNPGEDYQCRCYAEPDLSQILEGLVNGEN